MKKSRDNEGKYSFLAKNLLRGVLILILFVAAYILFRKFGGAEYLEWLEPIYSNPFLVFGIYTLSELFFGIITPEIFMAWGLEQGNSWVYFQILCALMLISYAAGYANYWAGRLLRKQKLVRWFLQKRMAKFSRQFKRYGGFLLVVASTTPLPYAAICLLVGTLHFPQQKFLLFTLTRLLRFMVYGLIVWQAKGVV